MARAYQPRRHSLRPQTTVDTAELLAAREDLCNVVKTSSGSSREKTTCAVNKVQEIIPLFPIKAVNLAFPSEKSISFLSYPQILMGTVPDRGGRPSEISAPPPEMPPWQKRQDGGGRGGWGGRGGGWRRGGWNQGGHSGGHGGYGGHGGKRGRYQY